MDLAVEAGAALLLLMLPRLVLQAVGRSGHGVARLFLPPVGISGWPHGVQERDERWGWRRPSPPPIAVPPVEPDGVSDLSFIDIGDPAAKGGLVVDVGPVRRGRPVD